MSTDLLQSDPSAAAREAAATLARLTGVDRHDVALVLGSGWVPAVDLIGETIADLAITDLPHFPPPAVAGHSGRVRSVLADGRRVLVFLGRTHYYEDRGVEAVVHGVRTAAAAGARVVVLTNGCGGLDPSWVPGTPVLISDHLNLTGASPLRGATFIDLTDLYNSYEGNLEELWIETWDEHPDWRGHQIIARRLLDEMLAIPQVKLALGRE